MGFPRIKGATSLSHRDFAAVNDALNPKHNKAVHELIRRHQTWASRALLGRLKASQFAVLCAITSRTFGWGKAIERIPLRHFREGIRDVDGEPERDAHGMPWFTGTGLDTGTIRKALTELEARGLIERFAMAAEGGEVAAYLPMSRLMLCIALGATERTREAFIALPEWFTTNLEEPRSPAEDEWCAIYAPLALETKAA